MPRQFHREIGVCIVLVDLSRGIAEQSDVEVIGRRHVRYSSHYMQGHTSLIPDCNLANGGDILECHF